MERRSGLDPRISTDEVQINSHEISVPSGSHASDPGDSGDKTKSAVLTGPVSEEVLLHQNVNKQVVLGDPTDPVNGGDPTDPVNRGGPTDPVNRGCPADPVNRGGPTDPVNRGGPTDPMDQGGPTDPKVPDSLNSPGVLSDPNSHEVPNDGIDHDLVSNPTRCVPEPGPLSNPNVKDRDADLGARQAPEGEDGVVLIDGVTVESQQDLSNSFPRVPDDPNTTHDPHELVVDLSQYLDQVSDVDDEMDAPGANKSGDESDEDMRKDKTAVRLINGWHDDQDEPSYNVSYTPAKKGGHFGLPMGALLSVPAGIFGKKDSVSCHVASPSERWRYTPNLPANERAISEIFTLTSSFRSLRKPLVLQIPYYPVELEFNELNVKGLWDGEVDWTDIGFIQKEASRKPAVEIEADRAGTFVVTLTPKKELFEIPSQGCLYNARISRYISVRFPKKAVDSDMPCCLQINPISPEKISLAKEQCPFQCGDLETVSEFIDITPDSQRTFRRAASIKLPLPGGLDSENDDMSDVVVLQKNEQGWGILDTNYRFTKTTVTFDVKHISRFCVAQAKPGRQLKLKEAITVLEDRTNKLKGEILVFLSKEKKSWVLLVEVVAEDEVDERTEFRNTKGFRRLKKEIIVKPEPEVFRFSRRSVAKQAKPKEPEQMVIHDGMQWTVHLEQDLQIDEDSDMTENPVLQYFGGLRESYRRFKVEPRSSAERDLIGTVFVTPVDQKARDNGTFQFKMEFSEEEVKEYFKPEYVPPPTPVKPEIDLSAIPVAPEVSPTKPSEPSVPRFKPLPKDVMDRLTRSNKRPVILEKESKVLTGKSLMALAKVVQEGLTLAVHLDLPDSTITGIGFDALSNGNGMVDVTYKILLHWKRQLKDKKDAAVEQLCLALRDMGRQGAAMAVLERHRDNKELDMSCFEITSV